METGITLSVYPGEGYHYDVVANIEDIELVYKQDDVEKSRVSFGSIEEMEAVAKAMLRAAQLGREM